MAKEPVAGPKQRGVQPAEPTGLTEPADPRPETDAEYRERFLRETVVVCPRNDVESDLILRLCEKLGVETVQSSQPYGARVDKEPNALDRITGTQKPHVIIIEMPGPEVEEALAGQDCRVTIIDHHWYTGLDRTKDSEGNRLPSSLEQFLNIARITDEDLQEWEFDPKAARGIGVMDDRYAQGLRDEGYTQEEINAVLDLREQLSQESLPDMSENIAAAKDAWARRREYGRYTIVESEAHMDVRGAVGIETIRDGVDTQPNIVSVKGGEVLYVQQVEPELVEYLKEHVPGKTFSYGAGQCWGFDHKGGSATLTLQELLGYIDAWEG